MDSTILTAIFGGFIIWRIGESLLFPDKKKPPQPRTTPTPAALRSGTATAKMKSATANSPGAAWSPRDGAAGAGVGRGATPSAPRPPDAQRGLTFRGAGERVIQAQQVLRPDTLRPAVEQMLRKHSAVFDGIAFVLAALLVNGLFGWDFGLYDDMLFVLIFVSVAGVVFWSATKYVESGVIHRRESKKHKSSFYADVKRIEEQLESASTKAAKIRSKIKSTALLLSQNPEDGRLKWRELVSTLKDSELVSTFEEVEEAENNCKFALIVQLNEAEEKASSTEEEKNTHKDTIAALKRRLTEQKIEINQLRSTCELRLGLFTTPAEPQNRNPSPVKRMGTALEQTEQQVMITQLERALDDFRAGSRIKAHKRALGFENFANIDPQKVAEYRYPEIVVDNPGDGTLHLKYDDETLHDEALPVGMADVVVDDNDDDDDDSSSGGHKDDTSSGEQKDDHFTLLFKAQPRDPDERQPFKSALFPLDANGAAEFQPFLLRAKGSAMGARTESQLKKLKESLEDKHKLYVSKTTVSNEPNPIAADLASVVIKSCHLAHPKMIVTEMPGKIMEVMESMTQKGILRKDKTLNFQLDSAGQKKWKDEMITAHQAAHSDVKSKLAELLHSHGEAMDSGFRRAIVGDSWSGPFIAMIIQVEREMDENHWHLLSTGKKQATATEELIFDDSLASVMPMRLDDHQVQTLPPPIVLSRSWEIKNTKNGSHTAEVDGREISQGEERIYEISNLLPHTTIPPAGMLDISQKIKNFGFDFVKLPDGNDSGQIWLEISTDGQVWYDVHCARSFSTRASGNSAFQCQCDTCRDLRSSVADVKEAAVEKAGAEIKEAELIEADEAGKRFGRIKAAQLTQYVKDQLPEVQSAIETAIKVYKTFEELWPGKLVAQRNYEVAITEVERRLSTAQDGADKDDMEALKTGLQEELAWLDQKFWNERPFVESPDQERVSRYSEEGKEPQLNNRLETAGKLDTDSPHDALQLVDAINTARSARYEHEAAPSPMLSAGIEQTVRDALLSMLGKKKDSLKMRDKAPADERAEANKKLETAKQEWLNGDKISDVFALRDWQQPKDAGMKKWKPLQVDDYVAFFVVSYITDVLLATPIRWKAQFLRAVRTKLRRFLVLLAILHLPGNEPALRSWAFALWKGVGFGANHAGVFVVPQQSFGAWRLTFWLVTSVLLLVLASARPSAAAAAARGAIVAPTLEFTLELLVPFDQLDVLFVLLLFLASVETHAISTHFDHFRNTLFRIHSDEKDLHTGSIGKARNVGHILLNYATETGCWYVLVVVNTAQCMEFVASVLVVVKCFPGTMSLAILTAKAIVALYTIERLADRYLPLTSWQADRWLAALASAAAALLSFGCQYCPRVGSKRRMNTVNPLEDAGVFACQPNCFVPLMAYAGQIMSWSLNAAGCALTFWPSTFLFFAMSFFRVGHNYKEWRKFAWELFEAGWSGWRKVLFGATAAGAGRWSLVLFACDVAADMAFFCIAVYVREPTASWLLFVASVFVANLVLRVVVHMCMLEYAAFSALFVTAACLELYQLLLYFNSGADWMSAVTRALAPLN